MGDVGCVHIHPKDPETSIVYSTLKNQSFRPSSEEIQGVGSEGICL